MTVCSFNGDHDTTGATVEVVMSPKEALPDNAVFSMGMCEKHLWPGYLNEDGSLKPGEYHGVLHIMEADDGQT